MQAVILAGGRGTRLGEATRDLPKPMLDIGEKPLLHHQVEMLVTHGYTDIIFLVNYLKTPILDYFGDGSSFGCQIRYFEELEPLGTAGGFKEIEQWLNDDFLVVYGDVMFDMDLSSLRSFHLGKSADITLVLHPNDHPVDSDLVETDADDRVTAFHSKPHDPDRWFHNLVNAGVYILSRSILPHIKKNMSQDFGRDIFPRLTGLLKLYGYNTPEYLKDMGTPHRLEVVRNDYNSGRISQRSLRNRQRAVFLDRDGVLNEEKSFISHPKDFILYPFAPVAVRKLNQCGYLAIVVTNQSAVARNLCTEQDVREIHAKMETLLGEEHAWLDAVYYCPHHPDKGFPEENPAYKIDCDCRKPKTGMFRKAMERFNIDPALSFMIGDTERDIQAGRDSGCITIGVRTGYGLKSTKFLPDLMFENLAEAVDFLVDDPYSDVFEESFTRFSQFAGGSPYVILVGGNARSGKSTLANYLKFRFQQASAEAMVISLDDWLTDESERTEVMTVYDRYRLKEVERDIAAVVAGDSLTRKTYRNHRSRPDLEVDYNAAGKPVLIIEGVVAISSPQLRNIGHLRLFLKTEHAQYLQRMKNYHKWRGFSDDESEMRIKKREKDEYGFIEKESTLADLVINPHSK